MNINFYQIVSNKRNLIILLIILFIILAYFYLLKPNINKSSSSSFQTEPIRVYITDAFTKLPVSKAKVMAKESVFCPAMIGADCPEGNTISQTSNDYGEAILHLDEENDYYLTVSHPSYLPGNADPYTYNEDYTRAGIKDSINVELISRKLSIRTKEEAIAKVKESALVSDWLSTRSAIGETAVFSAPYWTVEFTSKSACKQYNPTNPDCSLFVQINSATGEVQILASPTL